jgi:hypothetical protein
MNQKEKPLTKAQEIFGRNFGNTPILNERPDYLRSDDSEKDKALFRRYRQQRRMQVRVIKNVLR